MYETLSCILCVFAVFGLYIALKIAVRALFMRRGGKDTCENCRNDCPKKGTRDPNKVIDGKRPGEKD